MSQEKGLVVEVQELKTELVTLRKWLRSLENDIIYLHQKNARLQDDVRNLWSRIGTNVV
jgi:predicted nuclease with TOPRIM domain